MKGTLVFDIETHSAKKFYSMSPEEFVRLIGYKWVGDNGVTITTDLEELKSQIRMARWIIGHNINDFDLRAVFGIDSDEPMELAEEGRVYDTWTHAVLVHPAPYMYINRHGTQAKADTPDKMKAWFSLDEQAFQLGVKGKTNDIRELAESWGAEHFPHLKPKEQTDEGFGVIPLDDLSYRQYLEGDVEASEVVAKELLKKGPLDAYALREQSIEARKAVISSNGFRVDQQAAQDRVDHLAQRREVIMSELQERYGLPDKGKSPWDTNPGKAAVMAALADHGITPQTVDWPKTPSWNDRREKLRDAKEKIAKLEDNIDKWAYEISYTALPTRSQDSRDRWIEKAQAEIEQLKNDPLPPAFGLSLSGDTLKDLTKGTDAEELGEALAELKGQRSLAQLALDSVEPDGFAHPDISMLQRSGRWSTTKPGLTVWTSRGPGAVEKKYFVPDNEDHVLLEIDYSNADARIVAALSGDTRYAERFEPGADGHMINAIAAWGEAVVMASDESKAEYRQRAKVPGHGWGYRIGAKTLNAQTGMPVPECKQFLDNMNKAFRGVVRWQEKESGQGGRNGYVINDWGRKMWIEDGRAFTQAPALQGQSGTREIVCDAILAMHPKALRCVKAQIHDAMVFSVPRKRFEQYRDYFVSVMEASFKPKKGGQLIHFPVDAGKPGENWYDAGH